MVRELQPELGSGLFGSVRVADLQHHLRYLMEMGGPRHGPKPGEVKPPGVGPGIHISYTLPQH